LTLINSTVSGNGNDGIEANNSATMTVTNSTVANNGADGIEANNDSTVTVTNGTLAGNGEDGIDVNDNASGRISNTLLADNVQADCAPGAGGPVDGGGNFVEDGTCGFPAGGDPGLGPLAANGGPTMTMAITTLSPAYNVGVPATCAAPQPAGAGLQDQRGFIRAGSCSAGAFEPNAINVGIPPGGPGGTGFIPPPAGGPVLPPPAAMTDVALVETATSKGRIAVRWYTFTLTNLTTTDASGVDLTVDLPAGFKVDRSTLPEECTRSSTRVRCRLDTLDALVSWTVEVKLYGGEHPPATLPAVVEVGTPDINLANNSVS
jgi:hypothetical protein